MTSTRTKTANPTGIQNYDVSQFARLPGWQRLSHALNDFVVRMARTDVECSQDDIAKAVAHLARGIAFMDCCSVCERFNDTGEFIDTSAAPYATTIGDGWLRGRYRCAAGHEWTCGYALDRGAWFA